jgi:glycosyltransferase involved in cell wall biosynthesis
MEMNPPKLMHVVLSMDAGGGAERLVYDLVRDRTFAAAPPVVCCLRELGTLGSSLRQEGYRVHCRPKGEGVDWSVVRWLAQVIRQEGVEVVHAHQYTPMFYAVPAALLAGGKKVIYTEHGRLYPDLPSWKRRLVNPLLSMGIDQIVSISEGTKTAMVKIDNFSAKKIEVIHNGVIFAQPCDGYHAESKRRSLGLNSSHRLIGTAARLEEIKNFPMMLRGFRRVLERLPDTRLLVAGRGSQETALKKYAQELGLEDKVHFLGLRDDLPEIYPLLEIFLLTSYSEGISVTLLEAMSHGIPTLATRVGGNPEVVLEGETGLLVAEGDDQELARKILELLTAQERARQMGALGRVRASSHFSFEKMVHDYLLVYQRGKGEKDRSRHA